MENWIAVETASEARRLVWRSPLLRKSVSTFKQVPRFGARLAGKREPPYSLVANSFPKSGTHLLVQILEAFPKITNYDSFIATVPPIRFKQRSDRTLLRRIDWIVPGELVSAHLYYKPLYVEHLARKRCIVFFIYRDPRAVAVSEAHYLTYMNPWHRLHRYFANGLSNDADRLSAAIVGVSDRDVPSHFPSITERFAPYAGWLEQEIAYAVKFEDVMSSKREAVLLEMIDFFNRRSGQGLEPEPVVEAIRANIAPERSRTFRSGRTGGWREVFGPEHIEEMKFVAGDLLIRLGYEKDLNW